MPSGPAPNPRAAPTPGRRTSPRLSREQLLAPFADRIRVEPPGLAYRLGVLLVALLVVLLPMLYLALIAAVGGLIWWYATSVPPGFGVLDVGGRGSGRLVLFAMIAYGIVYVVAGIVLLLMLKPLLPRRQPREESIGISRAEQPLLYEFVDRLCRSVKAPPPTHIVLNCQVNAAAAVRKGLLGGGDITLVIGMPLAAGMTLRQLTGVLAHEFGHFAQGGAAYTERLVSTTVNAMGRAIFERDAVDDVMVELAENDESILFVLVGRLSMGAAWAVRGILFILFYLAHRVSFAVRRQREYDADRYEIRVAGSRTFVETSDRLLQLNLASGRAYFRLRELFGEGRLVDDLPALIAAEARHVSKKKLREARDADRRAKRSWHQTHPPDYLRIAAAERLDAPGAFHVDGPASLLFRDFDRLCREVTFQHYKLDHELPMDGCRILPTSKLIADERVRFAEQQALSRFGQGLIHAERPIFPDRDLPAPANHDAAMEMLTDLRAQIRRNAPAGREAHLQFEKAEGLLVRAAAISALFRSGRGCVELDEQMAEALGRKVIRSEEALRAALPAWEEARRTAYATLERLQSDVLLRLHLATHLSPPADDPTRQKAIDRQVKAETRAMASLEASAGPRRELVKRHVRLIVSLGQLGERKPDRTLVQSILTEAATCADAHGRVLYSLRTTPFPFTSAKEGLTLAGHLSPGRPDKQDPPQVAMIAGELLDRWQDLYLRLIARISARAEAAERRLGLEPLPAVKEQ